MTVDFAWLYLVGLTVCAAGLLVSVFGSLPTGIRVVSLGVTIIVVWVVVMYLTGPVPRTR